MKLNLLLLVSGRFISGIGSTVLTFALSLYVLDITGTAGTFSLVLSLSVLPMIFVNMFTGVFVDRYNKKRIIVGSDILSGVIVIAYTGLLNFYPKSIVLIVFYVLTISTIQSFFNLAVNSSIPEIVNKDNIPTANAAIQGISAIVNIIGPIIGAVLYTTFGIKVIFMLNGIVLILSGIFEMFLKFKKLNTSSDDSIGKKGYLADLKTTFSYLYSQKIIIFFLAFAAVVSLIYYPMVSMVLTYVSYNIMKVSGIQLSIIQASAAVGTIAGASLISFIKSLSSNMIKRFFTLFKIQAILFILWLLPFGAQTLTKNMWVITIIFSIILVILSSVNTLQNVSMISYFQFQIPEELLGRVFGVFMTAAFIFSPVGLWLYGVLLDIFKWYYLTTASGIILLLIGIFAVKSKYFQDFINDFKIKQGEML
ncbi:MFS transporter [Ruminiclostridium herbifermentans]|uniref:MFS transporter n=2 Tax=Ruminiclostridium herbifermentans TaxID=2488810 RepID=A0A7H1VS69_9FIRM|nr:MFS transporter [Ruminiclostridium herbifermentans]